jgi:signal transduction histidine kinase
MNECLPGETANHSIRALQAKWHRSASWFNRARLAWVLWALAITLLALGALLQFLTDPSQWSQVVWGVLAVVPSATVGALLASRRAGTLIGWLFCLFALLAALNEFTDPYAVYTLVTAPGSLPGGVAMAWVGSWILTPANSLLGYLVLVFPSGRLPSQRWRWYAWLYTGWALLVSLAAALEPGSLAAVPTITTPFDVTGALMVIHRIEPLLVLPVGSPLVALQILRFRRARGEERQQLKWFTYACLLALIWVAAFPLLQLMHIPVSEAANDVLWGLAYASFPMAVGIAMLKYHLYAIDLIINRTLVYGALTASVVGLYVLLVGALGALFRSSENPLIAILATGLVALLFHPLRQRVQLGINRLMYGERDEPYAVLARLGQRLEGALAPETVLPTIVETIAQTLKLPFVAIALTTHHQTPGASVDSQQFLGANEVMELAAVYGRIGPHPVKLPLVYQHETVGYLLLGARAGEALGSADLRLLADLARQAGVAASAVRLTTDLQRLTADLQQARERLVTAREEERRRLRRDLHDGLGPALASLSFKVEATRNLLRRDPERAEAVLLGVSTQAQEAIADIRRLVYALRPPALDELGLVSALREQVAKQAEHEVQITLEAPERLPALPAAVEVAAYRIAQEALTNVLRHANGQHCTLHMQMEEGTLCLEIADDGQGMPAHYRAGVGLRAMAERAAELGGSCRIIPGSTGGTVVHARLPVPQEPGFQPTVVVAPEQEA